MKNSRVGQLIGNTSQGKFEMCLSWFLTSEPHTCVGLQLNASKLEALLVVNETIVSSRRLITNSCCGFGRDCSDHITTTNHYSLAFTTRLASVCSAFQEHVLGKRKSFVDDLIRKRGIVSMWVALRYELLRFIPCFIRFVISFWTRIPSPPLWLFIF